MTWELHRAVGIWTVPFLALFALTGLSFVFPAGSRCGATRSRRSASTGRRFRATALPTHQAGVGRSIARARQEKPGQHVARVVMPFNDRAAFLVMFSASSPTPAGSELSSVYVDQYSGEVLAAAASHAHRAATS